MLLTLEYGSQGTIHIGEMLPYEHAIQIVRAHDWHIYREAILGDRSRLHLEAGLKVIEYEIQRHHIEEKVAAHPGSNHGDLMLRDEIEGLLEAMNRDRESG
jgi:hypothetical protein